ncbi:MAG TPA: CvpA family protein [Blastocatellia bacterium]|nr:CvpA family protein [Blastocatellia bacterium]
MTLLDYFVILIVVMSVASSAANGVVRCSITLISVIAGLILASWLYIYPAKFIGILTDDAKWTSFIGFALVFVLVVIAGTVMSHMLRERLQRSHLTWIDKMLGALFGFVRGWLIAATIYMALIAFPIKLETVQDSVFGPYLASSTEVITHAVSEKVRSSFNDTYSKLQTAWSKKERSSRQ